MKYLIALSLVTNIVFLSYVIDISIEEPVANYMQLEERLNETHVYLAGDKMSERELQEVNLKRLFRGQVQGATYLSDDNNSCVIYARTPKNLQDRERMAILGHELLHCYLGSYHTQ